MGCAASELENNTHKIEINISKLPSEVKPSVAKPKSHGNYPPPTPPKTKKTDIFHLENDTDIDQYASKVPVDYLYKSYEALVGYLTRDAVSDLHRVRALFKFATSIDIGMLQNTLSELPDPDTPLDYLLKINWQMGNHSFFFATLCRTTNIPCVIINGINKSSAYELGGKLNHRSLSAQWNAVLIDNQWRLLDLLWASTCVVGGKSKDWAMLGEDEDEEDDGEIIEEEGETHHQVNEFFFLTDPEKLIYTHLPENPVWQLLEQPIQPNEFESRVYIRERFFQIPLHMTRESHNSCILDAETGTVDIKFGITRESRKVELHYMLFRQRHFRRESVPHFPLEQYVLFQKTENSVSYKVQFPVQGRFKMDIFGRLPEQHVSLDLVCSYLIECSQPVINAEPLPDQPVIGWGPGIEAEDIGLKPKTHSDAIIETSDGTVEIKFDMTNEINVLQNLKHNDLQEWLLQKHAVMYVENGELNIKLRLPEEGQYALNLFGDEKEKKGDLSNVCNYLINCAGSSDQRFPNIPDGMLGKSALADNFKVTPKIVEGGKTIPSFMKANDGSIQVSLEKEKGVELYCEVNNPDIAMADLAGLVSQEDSTTSTTFNVNFPKKGEYALNIFAKKKKVPTATLR